MQHFLRIILYFIIILNGVTSQDLNRLQLVSKFEMNFNWLDPTSIDSSFFDYDSFTYAGFSQFADDCYEPELDLIEPPPTPPEFWCRLAFPHNYDGTCWDYNFDSDIFTQDIRYQDNFQLENDFITWIAEFSAYMPGLAKIFFEADNFDLDCEIQAVVNSTFHDNLALGDSIQFFYPFVVEPMSVVIQVGHCNGLAISEEFESINPNQLMINNVWPNPFNPEINIEFNLSERKSIDLKVFDLNGNLVESIYNNYLNPGNHQFNWQPENRPSGQYYLLLEGDLGESNIMPIIYIK